MKFTKITLDVLKSFNSISKYFEKDHENCFKISDFKQSIFATYVPSDEELEIPNFASDNLKLLLSTISKSSSGDYDVEFISEDNIVAEKVNIKSGKFNVTYTLSDVNNRPFINGLVMSNEFLEWYNDPENIPLFEFNLDDSDIKSINKFSKDLGLKELVYKHDNGENFLVIVNNQDPTSNKVDYKINAINITDLDSRIVIDSLIFQYLFQGNYHFKVYEGLLVCEHNELNLTYSIGLNE